MNANQTPCAVRDTELLAYRDGELAPARQTALAAHVANCPSCQKRLGEAALLTETLRLNSPERDRPVARAAIHHQIAGDRAAWWRHRAVVGTVLPAAMLLLAVIGFNRWLQDETCDSCPPLPTPMQITVTSGLPAGWGALLPCPAGSAPNRSLAQANSGLPTAWPLAASAAAAELGQDPKRQPAGASKATTLKEQPSQAGPGHAGRQIANGGLGCAPGSQARQPGLISGSALGATTAWTNPPGS